MTERELTGLTDEQAAESLKKYGRNEQAGQKKQGFFGKALGIVREPMFLLLLAAAVVYFILGEPRDGAIMFIFVIAVIAIEIYQEWKTDKTLNALKDLSAPTARVIRGGTEKTVPSAELVPGDVMLIYEGVKIPADGKILRASDLCVDESSLTGESEGIWKKPYPAEDEVSGGEYWKTDMCYAGTLVTRGSAAVLIEKTGPGTEYGKIGKHVAEAPERPTPLEKQIGGVVKVCSVIALVFFLLAILFTYFNLGSLKIENRLIQSVLSGITLSMAMIPEEFPVILAVFLSMGAWRLARRDSLIRRLPAVETLGAVSALCVDKTGTITVNQMSVRETWSPSGDYEALYETMGLACEADAYDPMEKAMLSFCEDKSITRKHLFESKFLMEYAFTDELKMMGHIWVHEGRTIIAAKGSPESILSVCGLSADETRAVNDKIDEISRGGLRVIAVASAHPGAGELPKSLADCGLGFCGLIGLADPPREGVREDIARCLGAGIRVIMITGDGGMTAGAIAKQVGIPESGGVCTGAELEAMTDEALRERVENTNIFSRVLPEHKMRIVKALRANGEVVAMTGDGVNDAPALKYADIGIAMGGRGSEVCREAADLILLDDRFSTIVETVRDGRRIYDNIKKAIGYVFTIHIPIALAALLAPLLKIGTASLMLLPLHVVLMELLIDPTCSIVLERQPEERGIMTRPPRASGEKLLSARSLFKSFSQGLAVFAASFGAYYVSLRTGASPQVARATGLCIIMLSNLFLVQVNSSGRDNVIFTFSRLMRDRVMWAVNILTVALIGVVLYTPLSGFLKLAPLSPVRAAAVLGLAAASVLWYEIVKFFIRHKKTGGRGLAEKPGSEA